MRLLVAEDDALLGEGIQAAFKIAGYAVDWVQDGQQALLALEHESYSACVLDLSLHKLDGLSLLKTIRQRKNAIPVLILTARDSRQEKIAGLDAGADDYLTKPFDLPELQARIRALLRRAVGSGSTELTYGAVMLDSTARRVFLNQEQITLSSKEYALLYDLLSHQNHVRARGDLEQTLYGWGEEVESNAVEVHIHHLRKKLGADLIRTVRGMGYVVGSK